MTIAELFVKLGIKGTDSAGRALKNVKGNLGEVKSMSLEAKAAIIGVVYGLQKMMSASAQQGTNLANFNALTGVSVQRLQEWQYAARQVGVANEDVVGSIKAVQGAMTNMLLGKGAPEGLAMLANKVGFDMQKARDPLYVMQQLQKAAKEMPPDIFQSIAKSFGVGEGMQAAMQRNAFRPDVFAKAPKYSDAQIKALDKVNVMWGNLGEKIQRAFGNFTAKDGGRIVTDITKITDSVIKLVDALLKLEKALGAFKLISRAVEGWAMIIDLLTEGINENVNTKDYKSKREPGKGGTMQKWKDGFLNDVESGKKFIQMLKDVDEVGNLKRKNQLKETSNPPAWMNRNGQPTTINNNMNMNFNHDGKNAEQTGRSVKKAVQDAYRQNAAQAQGS
jgi:hypothetical protein